MSFDPRFRPGRALAVLAMVALAGMLSACQVRPLYSENAVAPRNLAAIAFSPAEGRVGQEVRNHLIFLTSGGAGEARNPQYEVALTVSSRALGVLLDGTTDTPRAGRVIVTAGYTLRKTETGEILKAGHRSAVALADFSAQEFAKLRAVRDAENRAAREVAELVRLDLAAALAH